MGGSMWVQQRMMTTSTPTDPSQASMNRMMLWMMPIMFGVFTFGFPIGLSLYWVVSTLVGIVLQYRATGLGTLIPAPAAQTAAAEEAASETSKEMVVHGEPGSVGEDSGRGDRDRPKRAGRRARRDRRRRRRRR
ncbi:MAG: YidC/Oxa1 family membrane protein insertase [Dehalococcoidia bacterium]